MAMQKNWHRAIGFVGKDPVVRTTQGGKKYATFSIATTEQYKDSSGAKVNRPTEWHNFVAWEKLADVVERFVKKGAYIMAEGQQTTQEVEKDGQKIRYTSFRVTELLMLDRKEASGNSGSSEPSYQDDGSMNDDDLPF